MSPVGFFEAFRRYVWYRCGPTIAWTSACLVVGMGIFSVYPNMPTAAKAPLAFNGLMLLLVLMDALTLADKVETGLSVFPRQLFLLPTSSSWLALAPLGGGAAIMTVLGLELGFGATARYTGYGQGWWPVPFLVGTLCMLSAIAWRSYSHSTLRLLASLVAVAVLLAGPVVIVFDLVVPWQVGLSYAVTIPFSVVSAIRSVSRARCGEAARPWKLNDRLKVLPAFKSPMEAQVWLEVKRNGIFATAMLSVLITILGTIGAFVIWFSQETIMIDGRPFCSPAITLSGAAMGFSLMLLGLSGCCASVGDNVTASFELQPFLALRPMSTAQLVEAKMRMAVVVLVRCSAISLVGAVALLLVPSPANLDGGPTLFGLAETLSWRQVALLLVVYGAALVGAAKGMISGIWSGIGLLPRSTRFVVAGVFPAILVVVFLGGPAYLYGNPQYVPTVLAAVPYVAFGFVVFKLGLAGYAVRRLREMALVPDRMIVRWVGIWLGIALVLICVLAPFRSLLGLSLAGVAFAQLLSLPFGRVGMAPILVSANRHR